VGSGRDRPFRSPDFYPRLRFYCPNLTSSRSFITNRAETCARILSENVLTVGEEWLVSGTSGL
jgi:hypothetical protein